MDTAQEVLAAIRALEVALQRAEARVFGPESAGDELAARARAELDLLAQELARLRREFAVQLARELRAGQDDARADR